MKARINYSQLNNKELILTPEDAAKHMASFIAKELRADWYETFKLMCTKLVEGNMKTYADPMFIATKYDDTRVCLVRH